MNNTSIADATTTTDGTITETSYLPCRGCGGTGVQHNQRTGINEICPVCGGTGKMNAHHATITW